MAVARRFCHLLGDFGRGDMGHHDTDSPKIERRANVLGTARWYADQDGEISRTRQREAGVQGLAIKRRMLAIDANKIEAREDQNLKNIDRRGLHEGPGKGATRGDGGAESGYGQ